MPFSVWYTVAGLLLVAVALGRTVLARLPLTTSLVYLGAGVALGPAGLRLLRLDPFDADGGSVLLHLAEVAVLVSLFTAGLKLRSPLRDVRWRAPLRLATVSMAITIVLVAAAGVWGLGLPLGAAILLGAVLAPTDPVLASDVQVEDPDDRDRLRFALTGEAGLNDGAAFPFVMLGLGLLGLEELGPLGLTWFASDVLWATVAGLGVGTAAGWVIGRLVLHLRRTHHESVGTDDFLALGLVGLAYGGAELVGGWGFLAVFAAGLALRRIERKETEAAVPGDPAPSSGAVAAAMGEEADRLATDPVHAPRVMAQAVLSFNEQIERIGEVAIVLVVGALLFQHPPPPGVWWFVPALFLVFRPLAVWLGLIGVPLSGMQKELAAWFGLRGIGSVFYLAYAITHGLDEALAETLLGLTLWTIAASVVVHGISVTPLMRWYLGRRGRAEGRGAGERAVV